MTTVDSEPNTPPPEAEEAAARPEVVDFEKIFVDECEDIEARRQALLKACTFPPLSKTPTTANGLAGLALSGGGIRSAAFSLGALQALGNRDLIKRFDYLSTVSGGGYIGTTLSIGLSEGKGFPFGLGGIEAGETPITRHIRDNTRYLIPNGFRSVLTALVVYLRGLAMNALVILPIMLVAAAFLVTLNPIRDNTAASNESKHYAINVLNNFNWSFSYFSLFIGALIWILYSIVVSIKATPEKNQRDLSTLRLGIVLFLVFLVPLIQAHVLLLEVIYPMSGEGGTPNGEAAKTVLEKIYEWSTRFGAFLAPIAALPFVRRIAEQAVTEPSGTKSDLLKTLASRASLLLLAAAAPAILWLCTMHLASWATAKPAGCWPAAPFWLAWAFEYVHAWTGYAADRFAAPLVYFAASVPMFASWLFLSVNANSLHQLYRDRLGQTFLVKDVTAGPSFKAPPKTQPMDNHKLSDLKADLGPYHLLNTALNVPGSNYANRRGRNADFFVFSRRYVGSDLTGYVPTKCAEQAVDRLTTGTAMAISGAAAAPNMGMASVRPLSPTIALFNVRLGRWLLHPREIADAVKARDTVQSPANPTPSLRRWSRRAKPGPRYLLREAFSKTGFDIRKTAEEILSAKQEFVFLTDGGHIENLGVYELLKRRCRVIVAIDGEADPDLRAASLTQVERFARIDLGTRIVMDWGTIAARTRDTSQGVRDRTIKPEPGPHVALGLIDYPSVRDGEPREVGVLVYIKASLSGDEASYVMAYKARNPSFPHESTADQFFSEEQFEVYRALGEHIVKRFLDGSDTVSFHPANRSDLLAIVRRDLQII